MGSKLKVVLPSMVGKFSPMAYEWAKVKDSTNPVDMEITEKLKRQEKYFSLILVVKDFINPSNDGKIFVFNYGNKIYKHI